MGIITNEWITIKNESWGRLFAADTDYDKSGHYHNVETNPSNGNHSDKYEWKIYEFTDGYFLIRNKSYGYMMAASTETIDGDHVVFCYHENASPVDIYELGDKWKWKITEKSNGKLILKNKAYGQLFSADTNKKDSDHMVETDPTKNNNISEKYSWYFSKVEIKIKIKTSTWMYDLRNKIKNKKISQIAIPGTHDSGTYGITSISPLSPDNSWIVSIAEKLPGSDSIIANWGKAQEHDIQKQLIDGIRYFDLRVAKNISGFYIVHGKYSVNLETILEDVKDFQRHNPKEIIILDFNHFYKALVPEYGQNFIDLINKILKNHIAKSSNFCPDSKLNEFWAKNKNVIILFPEKYSELAKDAGFWTSDKISSPWPDTENIPTLRTKLLAGLNKRLNNKLYVSQAILTPKNGTIINILKRPNSLKQLSKKVNTKYIENWIVELDKDKDKDKDLNIFIVDFYTQEIVNKLISINDK